MFPHLFQLTTVVGMLIISLHCMAAACAAEDAQGWSYLIGIRAGEVWARNGTDGTVEFRGPDASSVLNAAVRGLGVHGGTIFIKAGACNIIAPTPQPHACTDTHPARFCVTLPGLPAILASTSAPRAAQLPSFHPLLLTFANHCTVSGSVEE